jgi:MFS family permease
MPSSPYQRYFLGRRDLLLLWCGQLASGFGDSLTFLGFLFLVLQLTGSEEKVGLFQGVAYVPILIFGLAAGVYVDRRDRRRVMLLADAGRMLVLLALPVAAWFGLLNIWVAGGAVVCFTTMATFFNPAYNSSLPIIVDDPARMFRVNAIMQSSRQFATIAGPIFAAAGVGVGGALGMLGANSVLYLLSFLCILFIGTNLRSVDSSPIRFADLRREAMLGLRTIMGQRNVRTLFLITIANNLFLMGPAVVGTPLLVRKVYGGSYAEIAFVELSYAVAMTITGVILHRLPQVRNIGRLWTIGLIFDGFSFLLYMLAPSLPFLYVATFIHALGIPLIVVPRTTIIQRLVPQHLLGRAFGYIDITVNGVMALSAGVAGFVIAAIGPLMTIVYGGAIAGVVGVIAALLPSAAGIRFDDEAPVDALPEPV